MNAESNGWGRSDVTCNLAISNAVAPFEAKEDQEMLSWAVTFLVIALIAAVFGLSGIAGTATNIAWILFVVFLIIAAISFVTGRTRAL